MSYKRQELFTLSEHLGSFPVFDGVCIDHRLVVSVVLCIVCHRPVSCVPIVASVPGIPSRVLLWYICIFNQDHCIIVCLFSTVPPITTDMVCANMDDDICLRISLTDPSFCSNDCIASNICPRMCRKCCKYSN